MDALIQSVTNEILLAANGGSPVSQGRLAQCHANGWGGLDVNYGESFHWFDKAAQSPDAPTWVVHNYACCFLWGRGTHVDPARAVSLLLSLAQGVPGFPDSQYQLGCCLPTGAGCTVRPGAGVCVVEACSGGGARSRGEQGGVGAVPRVWRAERHGRRVQVLSCGSCSG